MGKGVSSAVLLSVFLLNESLGNEQELLDLSYQYDENTAFWPPFTPFSFTIQRSDSSRGFWYAANDFKTAEHSGTHLDAPYHFNERGWKTAEIPLKRLITTGVFLNASIETNGDCNYKLPKSKLIEWENQHGSFPNNSVLLVSFGWSSRYNNKINYFGPPGKLCFPGLSKEASEWITDTKKVLDISIVDLLTKRIREVNNPSFQELNIKEIVGVGVDSPSVDQGPNVETHIVLNSNNIYMLENVAISQPLPSKFKIIVLPMKIAQGSGGPCRIVAVIDF